MTQDRLEKITALMNKTLPLPVTSEFVGRLIAEFIESCVDYEWTVSYFEQRDENVVSAYLAMMLTHYQP